MPRSLRETYSGRVGEAGAEADHRRLVADRVHAVEGRPHRVRCAHVRRRVGADVEHDGVVPALPQRRDDMGPDEPGTAGDQHSHALTLSRPSRPGRLRARHVTGP